MSQQDQGSLTQDEVYDLLSNTRRRFVISYLRDRGEPVELTALAKEVAAWENDTTIPELTDKQEKRVYVSLYQTHVPKLEDAGIVAYDRDSGLVSLAGSVSALEHYLPEEDHEGIPWQFVYLALAALGGGLYLLTAFDVGAFATMPDATAGVIIVLALAVVSLIQYVYARRVSSQRNLDLVERRR